MSKEATEALMNAIKEYDKAVSGDPRYRRALVALDDARRSVDRMNLNYDSPGRQVAKEVSHKEARPQEQEPKDNGLPRDFETAARMVHERFGADTSSS